MLFDGWVSEGGWCYLSGGQVEGKDGLVVKVEEGGSYWYT